MIRDNEHSGCQITLKMDGVETTWKTDQWDCGATQLIQAFAGLMIGQTFLPTSVWSCMKEEAEDQMRFLRTEELESKIENLEQEREFLEETVKKLEAQVKDLLKKDQEKLKEEDPGLLIPKHSLLDPKENCEEECGVNIEELKPMLDNYEEYVPDTEPQEDCEEKS